MALSTRTRLWEHAHGVAVLLNEVEDDMEREILQEMYERWLNDELFHGLRTRRTAATFPAAARVDRGDALLAADLGLRLVKSDKS